MNVNLLNKISLLSALFIAAMGAGGPAFAAQATVKHIRFGVSSATVSRVVVDLSGPAEYQVVGAEAGDNLSFKLKDAVLGPRPKPEEKVRGLIARYSARQIASGDVLVELSLKKYSKIKMLFSIPPSRSNPNFRIVLDIQESREPPAIASAAPAYDSMSDVISSATKAGPAPVANTGGLKEQTQPLQASVTAPLAIKPPTRKPAVQEKPVVVIDAGHGGTDPGALGPDKTEESKVTLAAALALADILRAEGRYKVVLTRSTDIRVAYEERTRIARDAHAGLFISLHADSIDNKKLRGGSVYTLNKVGTERSAREALSQNDYKVFGADLDKENPIVGGILYSKAQEWTGTESDHFAQILISKLAGVTPLLNNTHRKGNLIVLLSPDVPAVLFELAYITNPKDEANLKSPAWRKRTMAAVANAIDTYFDEREQSRQASNEATAATQ